MRHRELVVIGQIIILTTAFFFVSGLFASILYLLGEVSFAEVLEYLEILAGSEGVSIPVFLEGLWYYTFKKNRKNRDVTKVVK